MGLCEVWQCACRRFSQFLSHFVREAPDNPLEHKPLAQIEKKDELWITCVLTIFITDPAIIAPKQTNWFRMSRVAAVAVKKYLRTLNISAYLTTAMYTTS